VSRETQQFDSFAQWVSRASWWLTEPPHPGQTALCLDAKGRACSSGADFMRARDDDAFPVRWLWPDQVAERLAGPEKLIAEEIATIHRKAPLIDLSDYARGANGALLVLRDRLRKELP